MPIKKPPYKKILEENDALRNQLANVSELTKQLDDAKIQNTMFSELNEELNQTFEQLRKSKGELEKVDRLYKLLANNISDVIWIIDLNCSLIYISPSAVKLYGFQNEELINLNLTDILEFETFEKTKEEINLGVEKENEGILLEEKTNIWKQKRKNGETFWAEVISSPLRDKNNRLYAILGVTRDVTGRILVDEKMKKLSVAVEQNPASILITDRKGIVEYVNDSFTKLSGYGIEEILGKNVNILKSGETPSSTYKILWNTIMSGKIWQGEFINKKKNKEIFYENATIAPILDDYGLITNFVAIKTNITSQKFNEEKLKHSQEQNQMLFDLSLEGIMVYENGILYQVSQSMVNISGFAREELLGIEPIEKLFTHESIVLIEEKDRQSSVYPFEVSALRKNGLIYPAEVEIRRLNYMERDLKIIALRDLSYSKRVEDVLKSSLKMTEMLANHTENEIIQYGLEDAVRLSESQIGFFHFVNEDQKTINLHTWSKKTFEFCKIPDKLANYPISEAGTWIESFHERKPIIHNNYQALERKNGLPEGHFPLIRYISLPVIEDDKVRIIFGVGNKLENYNQLDVDILSLFAKTIWMIIQRKRTEILLTEANETKAKFLSIISHDLRSPIGSINSLTDMILENVDNISNEEFIKYIEVINQTSKSAYDQLENMLIWSRAQNDRLEFNPIEIDINSFIAGQIEFLKYLSDKKEIEVIFRANQNFNVLADRNMLVSIFRNLMSNSIKFTNKRGRIEIETRNSEPNFVEIMIWDNGIGIDSDRIRNLFQISRSTSTFGTDNEKGSGLGLLLCKEFVERNNGKIWAESKSGEGTQFYFTLPVY